MPFLSSIARRKKLRFFLPYLAKEARILEVGSGSGWLGEYLKKNGWERYTGIDALSPADIRGDINQWRAFGLQEGSFDALIAFEVVEHGDFYDSFFDLLRPGGLLLLTTPVPAADWFLRVLERLGWNQPRTSPHSHLRDIRRIDRFEPVTVRRIVGLSQWGVFRKPDGVPIDRDQRPA
jgi:SAM-dependent methyltransferase